jgi:hypothetical protein
MLLNVGKPIKNAYWLKLPACGPSGTHEPGFAGLPEPSEYEWAG